MLSNPGYLPPAFCFLTDHIPSERATVGGTSVIEYRPIAYQMVSGLYFTLCAVIPDVYVPPIKLLPNLSLVTFWNFS